jgi:hypothetical protein
VVSFISLLYPIQKIPTLYLNSNLHGTQDSPDVAKRKRDKKILWLA